MPFVEPTDAYRGRYRGFGALRKCRPWTEAYRAAQESRTAEATVENERLHAEWEALSRAAGVTPGSVAELRLSAKQAYYLWWSERNRELVEQVRSGRTQCCGEWKREGYYGWCSLLSCPTYYIAGERVNEEIVHLRRCEGCPVARAIAERTEIAEAWINSFFSFLKGLEDGNGIGGSNELRAEA